MKVIGGIGFSLLLSGACMFDGNIVIAIVMIVIGMALMAFGEAGREKDETKNDF